MPGSGCHVHEAEDLTKPGRGDPMSHDDMWPTKSQESQQIGCATTMVQDCCCHYPSLSGGYCSPTSNLVHRWYANLQGASPLAHQPSLQPLLPQPALAGRSS